MYYAVVVLAKCYKLSFLSRNMYQTESTSHYVAKKILWFYTVKMEFKNAIPNLFSKERHDIVKKYSMWSSSNKSPDMISPVMGAKEFRNKVYNVQKMPK